MVVERDGAATAASVVEAQPVSASVAVVVAAAAAAPPPPAAAAPAAPAAPAVPAAAAATVSAGEEYLDTITNEQARGWWKTYIGQRVATYNFLQDATMAWMLKVNPAMTQAEASIIAATVCFGIDRDGDGEITFAEFGKFSQELGNEYTVEKLRGYEVPRKDGQDVDDEKLAEYAEYLGISPETEKNILWIARRCMHAPLPKGWNEYTDEQGHSYFHHETKQETTWDHPLDSHFKQLVKDTRKRLATSAVNCEGRRSAQTRRRGDEPAFQRALQAPVSQLVDLAFRAIDTNGNGSFTHKELIDSAFGHELAQLWKDINTDGDEKIDQEEWRAFFKHIRDRAVKKMGEEKGDFAYRDVVEGLLRKAGIGLAESSLPPTDSELARPLTQKKLQVRETAAIRLQAVFRGERTREQMAIRLAADQKMLAIRGRQPEPEPEPESEPEPEPQVDPRALDEGAIGPKPTGKARPSAAQLKVASDKIASRFATASPEPEAELEPQMTAGLVSKQDENTLTLASQRPSRHRPSAAQLKAARDKIASAATSPKLHQEPQLEPGPQAEPEPEDEATPGPEVNLQSTPEFDPQGPKTTPQDDAERLVSLSSECSTVNFGSIVHRETLQQMKLQPESVPAPAPVSNFVPELEPEPEPEFQRQPKLQQHRRRRRRRGNGGDAGLTRDAGPWSIESVVDGMDDKRMRSLLKQLAADNPQIQRELADQLIGDEDNDDCNADNPLINPVQPSPQQQQHLELRESFLQRKPAKARPREAKLKAAAGILANATPSRLQRELAVGETGVDSFEQQQAANSGMSSRYDLKGKGRKAEEAKAEVNAQNAQTAAVLENPLRSPQLSSPAEDSPPKTRAAKLMEMRRKAAEAQAAVSAKKAQLAAQSATAAAKATESEQDTIHRRDRLRGLVPNALQVGGANGIAATNTSDVESFCVMSYEVTPVMEAHTVVQEPHHEEQKVESNTKLMLGHFAHALGQVFGGSSSEAAFMSKSAFALDKLFRSFGRSRPGRGMLNFPEFAGALRHIVSQHDMDKRYVETDVVADLFMFCDVDSDGFVSDVELRDFLLQHRRARRRKMRQNGHVARRKQVPRFRGPPPRRGKRLPRARAGPQRRVKIAPGLGLNRGVRGVGVRGRRRRKPLGAGGQTASNRHWKQQRDVARRQARNKVASVNTLHVQCAPVARRLLAAQTLQGWAKAFCRYDRTRARCMHWREFKQSVRAACRETFDGEDALFASTAAEEELRQLFRAIDSDCDGFIGTKEYKTFLVGCTSAFLSDIAPESGYVAALDKVAMGSSDDLSSDTHGLRQQEGLPSTVLLRRRRRGQVTSEAVGWMAPTARSQAMSNGTSIPKGRDSLGGPKAIRRRSQGSEATSGGVMLAPLVDATASFLRPTRVSRLGQREKHRFDERDLRYKSSLRHGKHVSDQATVSRRSASAMELKPPSQHDRRRRLSESSQQLLKQDGTQFLAKHQNRVVRAKPPVVPQSDVDAQDSVDHEAINSFRDSNSPVEARLDGQKQGGVDQVMLKLKSKAARRQKTAAAAAASLSETNGPADETNRDETKEEHAALNSSEESLQPWEKKPKKLRGPSLTGARIEITPIEVDLSSVAVVAPKVDKVMMMMKAKEEKKKQKRQELAKSQATVEPGQIIAADVANENDSESSKHTDRDEGLLIDATLDKAEREHGKNDVEGT